MPEQADPQIKSISAPPSGFLLQDFQGRIKKSKDGDPYLVWTISFHIASPSSTLGPEAGPVGQTVMIALVRLNPVARFIPSGMIYREDKNFWLRSWLDGKIAGGTYATLPSGVVAFVFGTHREVVMTVEKPTEHEVKGTVFEKPIVTFRSWFVTYGVGKSDRTGFAANVFGRIGRGDTYFPSSASIPGW
ncbi:hypothetical protein B9Z65_4863 [Elsinoe australis]|uniref:Uncharacterized protein n=1 Tax=Elsinoe australis TaxID=40998 RepID=A0A2P8A695_9PEZI|nr:hypothetical protein B9Z65_4863 [Elsinoe australis]